MPGPLLFAAGRNWSPRILLAGTGRQENRRLLAINVRPELEEGIGVEVGCLPIHEEPKAFAVYPALECQTMELDFSALQNGQNILTKNGFIHAF